MDDVELASELSGDGGEDVAFLQSYIGGKVLFGGKVCDGDIEAVEAPGVGLLTGEF